MQCSAFVLKNAVTDSEQRDVRPECVSQNRSMFSCKKNFVTHSERQREPAIEQILSLLMPIAAIGTELSGQMTEVSRISSIMLKSEVSSRS